jgi:hypothetical protein
MEIAISSSLSRVWADSSGLLHMLSVDHLHRHQCVDEAQVCGTASTVHAIHNTRRTPKDAAFPTMAGLIPVILCVMLSHAANAQGPAAARAVVCAHHYRRSPLTTTVMTMTMT